MLNSAPKKVLLVSGLALRVGFEALNIHRIIA